MQQILVDMFINSWPLLLYWYSDHIYHINFLHSLVREWLSNLGIATPITAGLKQGSFTSLITSSSSAESHHNTMQRRRRGGGFPCWICLLLLLLPILTSKIQYFILYVVIRYYYSLFILSRSRSRLFQNTFLFWGIWSVLHKL